MRAGEEFTVSNLKAIAGFPSLPSHMLDNKAMVISVTNAPESRKMWNIPVEVATVLYHHGENKWDKQG